MSEQLTVPEFGADAPEYVLNYRVPVSVHVDVSTGEVTRVVVIDEMIAVVPPTEEEKQDAGLMAALAIAEGDAEWPSWAYGY